jgi:hypothetical protein
MARSVDRTASTATNERKDLINERPGYGEYALMAWFKAGVHPEFVNGEGGGPDPEAIYNKCKNYVIKIMS